MVIENKMQALTRTYYSLYSTKWINLQRKQIHNHRLAVQFNNI